MSADASVPTVNASLIKVLFTMVAPVFSFLVTDIKFVGSGDLIAPLELYFDLSYPGSAITSIAQSMYRPGKPFNVFGSMNQPNREIACTSQMYARLGLRQESNAAKAQAADGQLSAHITLSQCLSVDCPLTLSNAQSSLDHPARH